MGSPGSRLVEMPSELLTQNGWAVLHLFLKMHSSTLIDAGKLKDAIGELRSNGGQVVIVSTLGHKSDICLMAISPEIVGLRKFQSSVVSSGAVLADSYFSLTEVSEYASGIPEEMKEARLHPNLPPESKRAWCFYPMSKRRNPGANWYLLDYDIREGLMRGHGKTGRQFAGRVLQLVTGSTGIDDFEWGVTLFANNMEDIKDVVYQMRYDEASAIYGEFGTFITGVVVDTVDEALELLNWVSK